MPLPDLLPRKAVRRDCFGWGGGAKDKNASSISSECSGINDNPINFELKAGKEVKERVGHFVVAKNAEEVVKIDGQNQNCSEVKAKKHNQSDLDFKGDKKGTKNDAIYDMNVINPNLAKEYADLTACTARVIYIGKGPELDSAKLAEVIEARNKETNGKWHVTEVVGFVAKKTHMKKESVDKAKENLEKLTSKSTEQVRWGIKQDPNTDEDLEYAEANLSKKMENEPLESKFTSLEYLINKKGELKHSETQVLKYLGVSTSTEGHYKECPRDPALANAKILEMKHGDIDCGNYYPSSSLTAAEKGKQRKFCAKIESPGKYIYAVQIERSASLSAEQWMVKNIVSLGDSLYKEKEEKDKYCFLGWVGVHSSSTITDTQMEKEGFGRVYWITTNDEKAIKAGLQSNSTISVTSENPTKAFYFGPGKKDQCDYSFGCGGGLCGDTGSGAKFQWHDWGSGGKPGAALDKFASVVQNGNSYVFTAEDNIGKSKNKAVCCYTGTKDKGPYKLWLYEGDSQEASPPYNPLVLDKNYEYKGQKLSGICTTQCPDEPSAYKIYEHGELISPLIGETRSLTIRSEDPFDAAFLGKITKPSDKDKDTSNKGTCCKAEDDKIHFYYYENGNNPKIDKEVEEAEIEKACGQKKEYITTPCTATPASLKTSISGTSVTGALFNSNKSDLLDKGKKRIKECVESVHQVCKEGSNILIEVNGFTDAQKRPSGDNIDLSFERAKTVVLVKHR